LSCPSLTNRNPGDDAEVEDDAPIDDDGEAFSIVDNLPPEFVAPLDEFEIPKFSLKCGDIQPGSIVELEDESGRDINHLTSGDFLLVRSIIENVKYGEISLRGYRMRRCKYVRPMFDSKYLHRSFCDATDLSLDKLNDVFMMLQVDEHDRRPRFVQGLEDVTPAQVKQIRKCVFTHLHSSIWNSGHVNTHVPARLQTQNQLKEWIFKYGTLICRYVYVVETHPKGQSYGGESRLMYKREVRSFTENFPISSSSPPTKRAPARPNKGKVLTFGDAFCGVGGTSQGARGAGYKVLWGLENSRDAMEGHRKNFPEAQHLEMDAHDFPSIARRCVHGCDHLHMSCPCCYWSENHTVEGKNDEANKLTLYTVEPTLAKVKPTTFSLEQAPGLLKLAKHRMYFRNLINGILTAGYRVRWRIQDQAWFGLGQHRRRLIFVGAK
jgi:DNA (cytosine-5)-methyltransferase 1